MRFRLAVLLLILAAPGAHASPARADAQRAAPPKIVKHVEPIYPEAARQARIQGVVVVEATIGPDGKVRDAKIITSIPQLDQAALAAVRQWEYEPTIVRGVASPVIMTVRVNFSLSGAAPAATPAPDSWDEVQRAASQLALDDKTTDAIAMVEKFVARNPGAPPSQLADAEYLLGSFHEKRWFDATRGDAAARRRDLEAAARHYLRFMEVQPDADLRFVVAWRLARLYGPDQLNDAAEAERYTRRLVTDYPSHAESHILYAQLLHGKGDLTAAVDVLRKGRAAVPKMPPSGLLLVTEYSLEQVQARRDLPRDAVRTLIEDAKGAADAILASAERDEGNYRLATMAKSMALDLQAERLAQTRQQRLDLLIEAERWGAPIEQHKNGAPPKARALSPAQKADLESQALRRWASAILDAMPKGDAAAARRAFEEVDAMLSQAQKLTPNDPDVKRLLARAQELRSGKAR
jgi:TonB family protein